MAALSASRLDWSASSLTVRDDPADLLALLGQGQDVVGDGLHLLAQVGHVLARPLHSAHALLRRETGLLPLLHHADGGVRRLLGGGPHLVHGGRRLDDGRGLLDGPGGLLETAARISVLAAASSCAPCTWSTTSCRLAVMRAKARPRTSRSDCGTMSRVRSPPAMASAADEVA